MTFSESIFCISCFDLSLSRLYTRSTFSSPWRTHDIETRTTDDLYASLFFGISVSALLTRSVYGVYGRTELCISCFKHILIYPRFEFLHDQCETVMVL